MISYFRTMLEGDSTKQVARLAVIGVVNTVNFFLLMNLLRFLDVALIPAVTIAFGLATFVSYVLNRRWTFGLEENAGSAGETARFYLVNIVAWAVTVGVITVADMLFGPLSRVGENLASLAAAGITLLPKFLSYRDLVFGKALAAAGRSPKQLKRQRKKQPVPDREHDSGF